MPTPVALLAGQQAADVDAGNGSALGCLCFVRPQPVRLKRTEQDLRQSVGMLQAALSEKTVLWKEIHHCVKNNLAVISSLLNMKAEITDDGPARVALEDSQRRVHSIALIHEHLYGSEKLDRINFAE